MASLAVGLAAVICVVALTRPETPSLQPVMAPPRVTPEPAAIAAGLPAGPPPDAAPPPASEHHVHPVEELATPRPAPPPPEPLPPQTIAPDAPSVQPAPPPPDVALPKSPVWTARIASVPLGALVYSGGRLIGRTPFSTRITNASSRHFVLRCEGYEETPVDLSTAVPSATRKLPRIAGAPLGVECE